MLENLLNTKLKKRLLNIFFHFPERSFSISELRAMTSATNTSTAKSLREFLKAEVIGATSRKQHRYFRINSRFPLHDELNDLVSDREFEGQDDFVSKILKRISNLKLVILSGIFTSQPHLPADLLLVSDGVNRLQVQRCLEDIEKLIGQEINFCVMEPEEFRYRKTMSDRFVRDILDYPHIVILNLLKYR